MDKLDQFLNSVLDGMTPELIQNKSAEYQKEFNGLMEADPKANEELKFRSFICHKVAVMDTVLTKIVNYMEEE
jgi:hypothetical protein